MKWEKEFIKNIMIHLRTQNVITRVQAIHA